MQSFPSYMTLSKYFNSWHLNFHISKDKENKKCLYDRDVVKTKMEKKKVYKASGKAYNPNSIREALLLSPLYIFAN